jgi:ABC-type bacteriocin/lantibiotic exporter with double-glycine peptidase domain
MESEDSSGLDGALFSIDGVNLICPSFSILRNITLEFEPLKLYLIAGPSGGGKTSLLRLLNGLSFPTSGEVRYRGRRISDYDLPKLRSEIVMLTQEPVLSKGSARQNILAPFAFASNQMKNPSDERLLELFARLGLASNMLESDVSRLSGGEKQRIALARAVLLEPKTLLADEPTSALDPLSEERVIETLTRFKESASLIVVSHSTRFLDIADEIILMSGGKVVDRRSSIDAVQFRQFLKEEDNSNG